MTGITLLQMNGKCLTISADEVVVSARVFHGERDIIRGEHAQLSLRHWKYDIPSF